MSERMTYPVKRGDPVQFILATAEGESITGYDCTASLKRLASINSYTPYPTVAADFTVTDDYAGGDTLDDGTETGPGWYLQLTADDTADLAPGYYLADALIDGPSADDRHTEPWVVQVQEVVT